MHTKQADIQYKRHVNTTVSLLHPTFLPGISDGVFHFEIQSTVTVINKSTCIHIQQDHVHINHNTVCNICTCRYSIYCIIPAFEVSEISDVFEVFFAVRICNIVLRQWATISVLHLQISQLREGGRGGEGERERKGAHTHTQERERVVKQYCT